MKVPVDAYKMDFVFANVPGGEGLYDNRGGYDYHFPVEGSPVSWVWVCSMCVWGRACGWVVRVCPCGWGWVWG